VFVAPPVCVKVGTILLVVGNSAQVPGSIEDARVPTGVLIAEVLRACQSAIDNSPSVMTIAVLLGLNFGS